MRFTRKKVPPSPWKLTWQTSPKGRKSRFTVEDADGKVIAKCYRETTAALIVNALEMHEVLEKLSKTMTSWQLIMSREFEHNVQEPAIDEAKALLDKVWRLML